MLLGAARRKRAEYHGWYSEGSGDVGDAGVHTEEQPGVREKMNDLAEAGLAGE
jgi:hypothetical protein